MIRSNTHHKDIVFGNFKSFYDCGTKTPFVGSDVNSDGKTLALEFFDHVFTSIVTVVVHNQDFVFVLLIQS